MNEELINEVLNRLDQVGAELSKGAAFGYEVLVRQQVIEGIIALVLSVLSAVAFVLAARFIVRSHRSFVASKLGNSKPGYSYVTYDMEDFALTYILPGGVFLLTTGMLSVVNFTQGLKHLLNPHYYAIYEILERVPG